MLGRRTLYCVMNRNFVIFTRDVYGVTELVASGHCDRYWSCAGVRVFRLRVVAVWSIFAD